MLERCLEICRRYNLLIWFSETTAALGCAYALAGRVAETLPLLEQAEQRDASMESLSGQALRVVSVVLAERVVGAHEGDEVAGD